MKSRAALRLLILFPLEVTILGAVAGAVASFLIQFIPGVTEEKRTLAMILFPIGFGLIGFANGLRTYLRLRKLERITDKGQAAHSP